MKNHVVLFFPRMGLSNKTFRLPISLLSIAAPLEKEGYRVTILDGNLSSSSVLELQLAVSDRNVICVGISAMTGNQVKHGVEAARAVREAAPTLPIVWGGWHASILPLQTAASVLVDVVVKGQGEATFMEVVGKLEAGISLAGTLGIAHKIDGKLLEESDRPYVDINTLPRPAYHLVDVEKYVSADIGTRSLNYNSSTGCPHRCSYCAIASISGRHWRSLAAERVIEDLQFLVDEYRINGVRFDDGNFFVSRRRVRQICGGLLDRGLGLKWSGNARAEQFIRFDDELLSLIQRSGCVELAVGAESGSQRILDLIEKDAKVDDTVELLNLCERRKMDLSLSFMVGLPGEEVEDTRKTLQLIRRLQAASRRSISCEILLYFFTPYPGTKLFDLAVEMGVKTPGSLEEWSRWDFGEVKSPWLDLAQQRNLARLASRFTAERFYLRALRIADELRTASTSVSNIPIKFVATFVRALIRLRIKYGFYRVPIERKLFLALQGQSKLLSRFIARAAKS